MPMIAKNLNNDLLKFLFELFISPFLIATYISKNPTYSAGTLFLHSVRLKTARAGYKKLNMN